jgi:hypothetical protein
MGSQASRFEHLLIHEGLNERLVKSKKLVRIFNPISRLRMMVLMMVIVGLQNHPKACLIALTVVQTGCFIFGISLFFLYENYGENFVSGFAFFLFEFFLEVFFLACWRFQLLTEEEDQSYEDKDNILKSWIVFIVLLLMAVELIQMVFGFFSKLYCSKKKKRDKLEGVQKVKKKDEVKNFENAGEDKIQISSKNIATKNALARRKQDMLRHNKLQIGSMRMVKGKNVGPDAKGTLSLEEAPLKIEKSGKTIIEGMEEKPKKEFIQVKNTFKSKSQRISLRGKKIGASAFQKDKESILGNSLKRKGNLI